MEEVLAITFLALSGVFKAFTDKISFHYDKSFFRKWNPKFWDPRISWRNKYAEGEFPLKEKFFGSSTVFVCFTDGWHLLRALDSISLVAGFFFLGTAVAEYKMLLAIFMYVGALTLRNIVFETFFRFS